MNEFLIALVEIKPVEPAFLDQDRDAQGLVFGVEGGLVSQVEECLALPGSKFSALVSFDLVPEEILLPLGLLESWVVQQDLCKRFESRRVFADAVDLDPGGHRAGSG
jgi:hypothetical protein